MKLKGRFQFSIGSTIALLILAAIWAIPTLGLLITSFRSIDDVNATGWWDVILNPLGQHWSIDAYKSVFTSNTTIDMASSFIATIVVTVPATILPLMIAAHAAYGFTFLNFKGKEVLFAAIVGLMVVPLQSALVPVIRGLRALDDAFPGSNLTLFGNTWTFDFNFIGNYQGAWLVHSAFALPLAIYILRNYMMTLPTALIEAARVDGASYYQIFWKLVMPMSVPALASFGIFQFLWVWNDYLIALIFSPKPVMTYQVNLMMGQYGAGWQDVAAGSFVSMLVPLTVFFALQRFFIRGLTAGSVK
jgi:alpha-glucoside transport system permease protein